MKSFILILFAMLLLGCNQDTVEKTKELNQNNKMLHIQKVSKKVENSEAKEIKVLKLNNENSLNLEKLKNQNAIQLAKIEAQKEQKLKEIALKMSQEKLKTDLEKKKLETNRSITVAKIENSAKVELKREDSSFYKVAVVILAIVLLIWAIIRYFSMLSKTKLEAELKEKEQAHEAYLQELKLKHENINKMLEIISDEKSDKEVKKAITKLLERGKGNFIEYRK